jgi:energy-coupling factor transporter transmembrane protein EcfT
VRHEIGQAWLAALRDPVVYIPLLLAVAALLAGRRAAPGAPELPPLVMGAAFGWTLYCVHVYGFETMDSSVYLLGPDAAVLGGIPSAEAVRPYSMYALAMGLRISSFLIAGLVFISTTRVEAFAAGLRSLGLPVSACFALSLGFRLVPTYAATAATVVQAQRSRGQDFERGGLVGRLRRYVPLIIPVIAYALRRADGLAMALESKGFGGGSKRTEFLPLRFGLTDAITLLVLVALAAGTIYARCAGHGVVLPRL